MYVCIYTQGSSSAGATRSRATGQDPYSIARAAAQQLDRRYPQLPLPPLSCYDRRLEEPSIPADILEAQQAAIRRDKERQLFVKRLRRMYNLSQSNTASTNRILNEHGDDFTMAHQGPTLHELVSCNRCSTILCNHYDQTYVLSAVHIILNEGL